MCEILDYSCDVLDMFKLPKFESICGKVMYYYIHHVCLNYFILYSANICTELHVLPRKEVLSC